MPWLSILFAFCMLDWGFVEYLLAIINFTLFVD
jgi:hypothetical protein